MKNKINGNFEENMAKNTKHDEVLKRLSQKIKPQKAKSKAKVDSQTGQREEFGGPKGLEPTRYNDWEKKGITRDF